jgi:hypothetical protein
MQAEGQSSDESVEVLAFKAVRLVFFKGFPAVPAVGTANLKTKKQYLMYLLKKWIVPGVLAAVVSMFSGCASVPMAPAAADQAAKQFSKLPDKANIFVYRNESMGAAIKMGLYLNDAPIGQTAAKTYVNVQVAPGTYKIRSHAENNSEVTLDAKAGEVYFLWQEVKMGFGSARSNLQIVNAETGKKGVSSCSLAQTQ